MSRALSNLGLAARSLLWTLLFPGFFAGYVPWTFFGLREVVLEPRSALHWLGLLGIGAGTGMLAWCILEFARSGRGTLSPADPPRTLVVRGPYRFVRNPMYLSVTLIVLGEVLLTMSLGLLAYSVLWFAAVNLFVLGYEEPTLRGQFGLQYERYAAQVGRWIPRLQPWPGASDAP
jgi:protein-S-isoprenylcysteine O-methyltransferase Ste14